MRVDGTKLFKVKALADMWLVSPATVYRLVESGQLPALRFGTGKGSLRVTGEAVNAYVANAAASADETVAPVWANLTDEQADGQACVVCGANYLTMKVAHAQVGRSNAGFLVFACTSHRDQATGPDNSDVLGEAA